MLRGIFGNVASKAKRPNSCAEVGRLQAAEPWLFAKMPQKRAAHQGTLERKGLAAKLKGSRTARKAGPTAPIESLQHHSMHIYHMRITSISQFRNIRIPEQGPPVRTQGTA